MNEKETHELLVSSQQPKAKDLVEYKGIKIIGHKYVCKQVGTIYTIQQVIKGTPLKRKHSMGLIFPEHILAIEFYEYDHKNRDQNYVINQQKFTEDHLNCQFIRYNPDAKDFRRCNVLNQIFRFIHRKE